MIKFEGTLLGKGSFGCVAQLNNATALKFILKTSIDSPEHLALVNEATMLRRCTDRGLPGVVKSDGRLLDCILNGEPVVGFLMEFIPGFSLNTLQGYSYPESTAIHVATELMLHVDRLHNSGMFHGDIKPHNIMIQDTTVCQVKLIDFGGATTEQFGKFTIVTPDYCAPEARTGIDYDKRSADVFSVGKVIDFLIKGRSFQLPGLDDLVIRMTNTSPDARPTLQQALARLSLGRLLLNCRLVPDFLQRCSQTTSGLMALLSDEQRLQDWLAKAKLTPA